MTEPTTDQPDEAGLHHNPATGSLLMPADWSPRPDDIPADRLAAILTNAVDLADGIRLGYRAGLAAAPSRLPSRLPEHLRGDGPCQGCGTQDNIMWTTESALWNRVLGGPDARDDPGGILCIPCFVKLADVAGVGRMWRLDHYRGDEPPQDDEQLVEALAQAMRDANTAEAWKAAHPHVPVDAYARAAVDVFRATIAAGRESVALSSPEPERAEVVPQSTPARPAASWAHADTGDFRDFSTPPVTPAADLADEAAHERVARAILEQLLRFGLVDPPVLRGDGDLQAYELAKAAIDAYRAGPTTARTADRSAIDRLIAGLDSRGITDPGDEITARAAVLRALAHIDRLTTQATDVAEELEHEVLDGGLTTDQEIRARALPEATRLVEGMEQSGDITIRDIEETTIGVADRYAEWIATGSYEWMADNPAQLRDRLDAASSALAMARNDAQRRHTQGYAQAVRRLRDDNDYRAWSGDHPDLGGYATHVREAFAAYVEQTAPDPDDPRADAQPIRREGSIHVTGALAATTLTQAFQGIGDALNAARRPPLVAPLDEYEDAPNPDASPTDGSGT